MNRKDLPATRAAFVSPGGFLAYEYLLAIPAAVHLHRTIGRDRIAMRVAELNEAFREGLAELKGVVLHTPRSPAVAGAISCYEVEGLTAEEVTARLASRRIRTNQSPYKVSYPRVAAGIMNSPQEIETVLREIRSLTGSR
jgi:selenocysteine lyase/cysteine desulfurase